jgi:hypothetical protein
MPNVQVFCWCTLSAVIGFVAGQLSPRAVSSDPLRSLPPLARPWVSPRATPGPATPGISAPLDQRKASPGAPVPSADAIARAFAPPAAVAASPTPVAVESAPLAARDTGAPVHRGSLLGAFRFTGVGPHGGMRIGRVARGSLPDLLGLRSGDEIVTLNGFRVAEPQQALQAYARLPYVDDWVVSLHRGGAPTELRYALR